MTIENTTIIFTPIFLATLYTYPQNGFPHWQDVALFAGNCFGEAYDNYVRISYCVDLAVLKKALDKVKCFVEKL
ncbi:MAG: hypothetical protein LBF81_07055 [Prevotellaceae bacterium]|nr:hypothetical protein [Prevotellaceae bacterium]